MSKSQANKPSEIERHELTWLAGLMEGEGSFMAGPPSRPTAPIITISMTDRDVIDRVAEMWGVTAWQPKNRNPEKWKDSYAVRVVGSGAVEWMEALRPYMGERRQEQIDKALACYEVVGPKLTDEQALEVLQRFEGGERAKDLADEYGISQWTVYDLRSGRNRPMLIEAAREDMDKVKLVKV